MCLFHRPPLPNRLVYLDDLSPTFFVKMSSVLMVAEKPSLARSLAEILSKKSCNRRKTMCSACDVYEWTGHFPALRGAARFKMTSVCGHVMGLDFPAKYNRWDQVDPVSAHLRT